MWSRIILGEPAFSHLVKKFPHNLRQSFITISTGPTTFPHMNSDNTLQSCICKSHFILCSFIVWFFHVVLSIMFPYKNPVCISFLPSYVPCPSNPPDFIIVITFGGEYESHMKDRTFKKVCYSSCGYRTALLLLISRDEHPSNFSTAVGCVCFKVIHVLLNFTFIMLYLMSINNWCPEIVYLWSVDDHLDIFIFT
jgi:hypothetical protein